MTQQTTHDCGPRQASRSCEERLFSRAVVALLIGMTLLVLAGANVATRLIQQWAEGASGTMVDRPRAWPFSVFSLRIPTWQQALIAVGVVAVFVAGRRILVRRGFGLGSVLLVGLVLVIGGNLIQGWQNGLVTPTSGTIGDWKGSLTDPLHTAAHLSQAELAEQMQYYDDAREVRSGWEFLRRFNETQPYLRTHSRTHPPGAVLVFWGLQKLTASPAAASVTIAVVSALLSGLFFHGLMRRLGMAGNQAGYMTFLLLLLPAVQVYYLASLDALIATFLLGGLFFFLHRRSGLAIAGATCMLIGASFLTFGWAFILPVLAGWELLWRRNPIRLTVALANIVMFYAVLYVGSGFSYLEAFQVASSIENPNGFYLLAQPVSYGLTRLECIAEILTYFGPFLLVLMAKGLRGISAEHSESQHLFWLGVGTLLAMFAAGAFRTGETARACLFIYPYLLLPVGVYLAGRGVSDKGRRQLLWLVFGQAIILQLAASFFW